MDIFNDARILWRLAMAPIRGESHAARLESFYKGQADGYDRFRRRLLQGREMMVDKLPLAPGSVWVDLGGGTGANLVFAGERLAGLERVEIVDLSPSLLHVAHDRARENGWTNVACIEADATTYSPSRPVDVVTFSYSLTMIPDWFAALENAFRMLKPGGCLGVVDFHVARKHPEPGCQRHGWPTRAFWPLWFACDNVFLSPDHLPWLRRHFKGCNHEERRARLPWLPLVRAPYYIFRGVKGRM